MPTGGAKVTKNAAGQKIGHSLNWYGELFQLIDMRSFSNLWYWIALAVVWSTASHWVLGVPFDMLQRARKEDGQAAIDFHDIVRVNINRVLYISDISGMWLSGILCFMLTALGVLGFYYWVEFAQAVFLLMFPMSFVGLLSLSCARSIQMNELSGEELYKRMTRHRTTVQFIGMFSILVTSMWGMYQNNSVNVLGG